MPIFVLFSTTYLAAVPCLINRFQLEHYFIEEVILEAKTEYYEKDKVKSPPFFDHFTTISSHFFDNYLYIFHKTEDQTVILRC